jgi:hypothetical protein
VNSDRVQLETVSSQKAMSGVPKRTIMNTLALPVLLTGPHPEQFLATPIRQRDDARAAGGLATLKRRFVQM